MVVYTWFYTFYISIYNYITAGTEVIDKTFKEGCFIPIKRAHIEHINTIYIISFY